MTQTMTPEAIAVAQTIFRSLLRLMPKAKKYAEPAAHSANKLVQYFSMLTFLQGGSLYKKNHVLGEREGL